MKYDSILYDIDFKSYPQFLKTSPTSKRLHEALEKELRQDAAPEEDIQYLLKIARIAANYASESIIKHNLQTIRLASSSTPLEYLDKYNSKEVRSIKTLLNTQSGTVMFMFAVVQMVLTRPAFKTYANDLKAEFKALTVK